MEKNKRVVIIISIVILTIINVFLVFKKDTSVVEKNKVSKIERKEFSILKEQTYNGKDWELSTDTAFPTSGYLLNTTKTVCKGYSDQEITPIPVTQELTDGVINGSITINSSKTIYCDLYFDKNETPTINTFNVTGKTSGGTTLNNSFTYQTDKLPFTVTYADNESDVKQYCINETNSIENCNWQTLSETSGTYTLTNKNDGEKTIYIYLKDKANNISVTTDKSTAKIIVDQTKPVVNTFTLTGTADTNQTLSSSTEYTHKAGITYNATIEESNIDSYCVYEDSCDYKTTSSTTLNTSYTLKDIEGSHTVNIRVKDKAGNESEINITSTKSITLDKTNPTATISKNTQDTSSITVIVGYSGTDSIIERQCRKSGGSWVTASNSNGSCTISNLSDGTKYTIEGRVRDASGRFSQEPYPSVTVTTESAGFRGTGFDLIHYYPAGLLSEDPQGMVRFAGNCGYNFETGEEATCDGVVDNYVCFGYDDLSSCKSGVEDNDYIYRIIGINIEGEMKLIKSNPLPRKYAWDEGGQATSWEQSSLYKNINGSAFYDNLDTKWQEIITFSSWPTGIVDESYAEDGPGSALEAEWKSYIDRKAKIGLLTVSDSLYSCLEGSGECGDIWSERRSWLFLEGYEWTMVMRYDDVSSNNNCWDAGWGLEFGMCSGDDLEFVRPVFYLAQDTYIVSGTGTLSDPFIVGI